MLKINKEHPNWKKTVRELEEKKAALSPERRNIFEALQDEERGECRMNEFAAMNTTEKLSETMVSELQSRLRRVRRGLELQEIR
jgi:hypothetical protein